MGLLAFALVTFAGAQATAQVAFPPVTNLKFNIDLFEQPAIASPGLNGRARAPRVRVARR